MTDFDVVIVGGGPAGLTAAVAAGRRGWRVALFESNDDIGGMAASFDVADIRVDHGSHRLHPAASAPVRSMLEELLGDDLQVRERNGRVRVDGTWLAFPFRATDLIRHVSPSFLLGVGRDALLRPMRRPKAESYAELVRVGLGPTVLDRFHGPMAHKLWGVDPALLSEELARRRLPIRNSAGLVRMVARTSRPTGRVFLYPRHGFGQIVERLSEAALDAGVQVFTGQPVTSVVPGVGEVRFSSPLGGVGAGRLLWTGPVAGLQHALGQSVRSPVTHRGLVLVYLVLPHGPWTEFDAHYVPDPEVVFSRLSEPRNYRHDDRGGPRTVLCAELPCSPGDALWSASDEELMARVVEGIQFCGLPEVHVDEVVVRRLSAVYPVLTVEGRHQRANALATVDHVPGITVLGRQGRLVGDNVHHVMDMALTAVGCIDDDGSWNDSAWREACRRFEDHVVQD